MKKLFSLQTTSVLFCITMLLAPFSVSAQENNADSEGYMIIRDASENNSYTQTRSSYLNSASYWISYSFPKSLTGQWRSFGEGSICFKTNPYADMSTRYDDRFYIKLVKRGWFNQDKGTRIARVNEGTQKFQWDNIEAGEYRLELKKVDENNDWVWFRDDRGYGAKLENCDH